MASFTGLRLASGLRTREPAHRRLQIAKAAFALGGGIWSMHFVAMLALRLPIAIGYDALYTLGSISGLCRVGYVPAGFFVSSAIAILFSICALRLAYGRRSFLQFSLSAIVL